MIPHYLVSLLILLLAVECDFFKSSKECPNVKADLKSLIRKKRYLTFPDGADVVLTISMVKAFLTHAPAGWNTAIEIDVLFPLPNVNFTAEHSRRKLHHRQKKELWERLRNAMEFQNLDGHSCILRSICDAKKHLAPPGKSLVHDILRIIFKAQHHETDFVEVMKETFDKLADPNFCDTSTFSCPVSFLSFITPYYKP